MLGKISRMLIIISSISVTLMAIIASGTLDWNIQQVISRASSDNELGVVHLKSEDYFSDNYFLARKRFIKAGTAAGAVMSQLVIDEGGPGNELLSIDIAWLGSLSPRRVLVHVSGVHGVEGFAGSAIQLKILEEDQELPNDSAVILVHVLNPYGMAWLRRYNESNVDLNRNFRFKSDDWVEDSGLYADLNQFLNPTDHKIFDSFLLQALLARVKYGSEALRKTIPKGQSINPKGLFYCGKHLEQGPALYSQWVSNSFKSVERMIILDVHTGLGKSGQESLFHRIAATDSAALSKKLNRNLLADYTSEGVLSYSFKGAHAEAYLRLADHCNIDFVSQEFGTYPNLYVLQALRDENRSHNWRGVPELDKTKLRLKEAFNPDNRGWQSQILNDGLALFNNAAKAVFTEGTE